MGLGSDAENRLTDTFFDPFFNWDDDARLREWLRGRTPTSSNSFWSGSTSTADVTVWYWGGKN